MGKLSSVYEMFSERLDALAPVEVIYGNYVEEVDPEEGWMIEANFWSNVPKGQGLAQGVMDQGFIVLGLVFPKGVGAFKPIEAVDVIKAIYPKGLVLYKNGFRMKVDKEPYSGAPLPTATKYTVPVTVEWVS